VEKKNEKVVQHDNFVMDILPIPEINYIASASMDASLCLWNIDTLKGVRKLEGHKKGIYCLEYYSPSNLILSAGVDHEIFVWNPIVEGKIFTLTGHNHSLVGVKWLKGTNQLVSADISGMFKIWDVRNFTPI
jgi:hypothetical protein